MNPVVGVCDSYIGTECDNHPDRSSMVNLQQAEATSVCVLYSIAGTTTYTTVATSAVGNGKGSDKDEKGVGPGVPASISAIKLVQVPVWEIPVNVPPSTSIGGIVYLPVQYVDLLGVTLLPEVAEIIKELFCNFRKFADLVCDVVVADYLSTISESSELSATGRYICCKNYRELHLSALMYRCLCVYNLRYRPNFIRTLTITGIQVLSSSSDRRLVPLTGSRLLDFLSRLDCAISNIVNSVFNLKWDETAKRFFSEVKEGSLGYVGCKDLIAVLDACGIPGVALAELRKHERQNRGGTSGSSRGTVGGTSGVGTIDLARSLPSSAQSFQLPQSKPQSRPRFSSPLREYAGSPSELIRLSSAVGPDGDVPLSVQCVDLLGVTLLPDSAEIINKLFRDLRVFARNFTGKAVTVHSFTNLMNSKLLEIGRAIWCKNYKEVQKSNFMYKCLCAYYSRQYPDFIRALAGIKILSSPSERRLVPLTGVVLLDFLSRLECAIRETLLHMFELDWGEMVGDIFDKLEERSLDAVNLRDFVSVLDVAGIPSSVTSGSSGYLRYFVGVRDIRDKNSRISSKITSEDVVLGSSVVVALPKGDAGSSSSPATIESVSVSTVSDKPVAALTVSDEPAGVTATDTVSNAVALPKGAAKSSLTLAATESVAVSTASDEPAGVTATDTVSTAVALPKGAAGSSSSLAATESVAVSTASDEPVGVTATDTVSTAVALPKGASKSSLTLAATESVAVSIASDEPAGVTATDTVSTAVALPKGAAGSSSSLVVTEPVAALTVSGESSSIISGDVLVSTVVVASALEALEDESPSPSSLFPSELGLAADTSFASPPTREGRVRLTAVDTSSELWGLGGESPSVSPASSSSYMYSSPSESGWDADLSSFSPESPLLTREVGLVEEGIASTLGALGESTPAFSSEQLIVPITASSSISAPIGESFTAAKGSSYSYFYGPKKSFIMQLIKGTFEVPTSSADIGPSSSALVDDVQPVAAANDIAAEEDDVGAGLAALLNRGFLPSTLIASESNRSIRVDRSGVSSSHHSGAQRGGGHKRKRS
ncbi:hypothetical protein [Candidatus Ichthyocystis sparus]|uniref:hypothetical protein n=1 Tax=Candidatus Ichthyocystis sparus TaxID=1561004 RepID=UPI000B1347BD|nr:hypothetical protein [Candidatus Ichthyocystis sparus]